MRKFTALSVALSLSAAGQAFAGEVHASHAAPAHVVEAGKEKSEVSKAKVDNQKEKALAKQEANPYVKPLQRHKASAENLHEEGRAAWESTIPTITSTLDSTPSGEATAKMRGTEALEASKKEAVTIRDAVAPGVEKIAGTAIEVKKAEEDKAKVIDAGNTVKEAAATAESHTATGK